MNIAEGSAGSAVEEDAIESVTDAPADRCEPLALRLARYRRCYDRRNGSAGRAGIAAQIGPIAVALDAEDVLGYLVIDAGRTADEEAGRGKATGCSYDAVRPIASASAEAAIDTKIEAGPVVDAAGNGGGRLGAGRSAASAGLSAATAIAAAATSLHLKRLSLRYRVTLLLFESYVTSITLLSHAPTASPVVPDNRPRRAQDALRCARKRRLFKSLMENLAIRD